MSTYVLVQPGRSFPAHGELKITWIPFINPLGKLRVKSRFGCVESMTFKNGFALESLHWSKSEEVGGAKWQTLVFAFVF